MGNGGELPVTRGVQVSVLGLLGQERPAPERQGWWLVPRMSPQASREQRPPSCRAAAGTVFVLGCRAPGRVLAWREPGRIPVTQA